MVSKESEYLIHLAEEQLERLNKSLYFYQRNAQIQDNLLNFSADSLSREPSNLSLTPVYAIIDRQRQEYKSREPSGLSSDIAHSKKSSQKIQSNLNITHSQSTNDNHIRDWRNMYKLAQKTLGPNKQTYHRCNCNQALSPNNNKKEKLSTFWDFDGQKRIMKMSKSAGDIEKSERGTTKCCGRRDTYSRNEIRKYIRDKQKLLKEKQCASNTKGMLQQKNVRTSMIKLNNDHCDDKKVVEIEHYDHFCDEVYNSRPVHESSSYIKRSSKNQPIYDELRKEGMFDYQVPRKKEYPVISSPLKPKNGLSSTVDSGFETGEWLQTTNPEAMKPFKDSVYSQMTNSPPKSLREQSKKEVQVCKSSSLKSKTGFYDKNRKQYKDQISAYDASSENEMGNDKAFTPFEITPPPSPSSCKDNDPRQLTPNVVKLKSGFDSTEVYLDYNENQKRSRTLNKSPTLYGKLSISLPNCNADFSCESAFKKTQELKHIECSQMFLVKELKEALLDAQRELNPNVSEPSDTLSERISRAVENFIKVKERKTDSSDVLNADAQLRNSQTSEIEHSMIIKSKPEYLKKLNESKRDHLSTEFEATEIEHEKLKPINKPEKIKLTSVVKHEIIEVAEERNSFSISSEQSEVFDELLKENITANLETRKKDLETRRDNANELIKLAQEFKKESKRVKLLERKACQFSKQFLKDSKFDKKTYDSKFHDLKHIGITKFSRYSIPPDGKDSGRSDIIDSIKNKLSPRMADLGFVGDIKKVEDFPPENLIQNYSEVSDVDEPTISISEISTSLTDQSELDAQLVALRTEMTKKHQLVVTLKLRQKEMKRDNIKQKEITLQKQIEMYDAYISKLQSNIDELDKKVEGDIEDDSHTLTGSTSTINEIESNTGKAIKVEPLVSIVMTPSEELNHSIDGMYVKCCEDYAEVKTDCFDMVVYNNEQIAGEDIDLDCMSQFKKTVEITSDIQDQVNVIIDPKKPSEGSEVDIDSIADDNGIIENYLNKDDFEEMVKRNSCCDDLLKDLELGYLYSKEHIFNVSEDEGILDELMIENIQLNSPNMFDYSQIKFQKIPEVAMTDVKLSERFAEEKKDVKKDKNNEMKQGDLSKETFSLHDVTQNCTIGTLQPLESVSVMITNIDESLPNINSKMTESSDFDKVDGENLTYSDDDGSSISDVNSLKIIEDLLNNNDWTDDSKVVKRSVENSQDLSIEAVPISSPVTLYKAVVSNPKSVIRSRTDSDLQIELLNSAKVEQLVEYLLNAILCSEFEEIKLQTVTVGMEKRSLLSVVEVMDFQSTSFIEPDLLILPQHNEEKIESYGILKSDDLWMFNEIGVQEPTKVLEPLLVSNNFIKQEEIIDKDTEILSTVDKELLKENIKWLIPFKSEDIETHIQSAILQSFQERQIIQGNIKESSIISHKVLGNNTPVLTVAEVKEALFEPSNQDCYIDKRIIYQLVKEIFLELYSFERYLPQMPWMHPSFMIKRNNYTSWKGDKPPESFDLVNTIVRERITHLFNQKNICLNGSTVKFRENSSHSKITKWCIERQKDQVDKILINDLCKEENDWVYYDEAEEEVKIQIAGDVFQFLVTDTVSWLKSISSQN